MLIFLEVGGRTFLPKQRSLMNAKIWEFKIAQNQAQQTMLCRKTSQSLLQCKTYNALKSKVNFTDNDGA